jgi:DNA-binding response OmpR family regulator
MEKILIIDPEKNSRAYLKNLLSLNGYVVETAEELSSVEASVFPDPPAFIISAGNRKNPGIINFIDEIRNHSDIATIPVLLLTDDFDEIEYFKRNNIGTNYFLMRPYRNIDILDIIYSSLRRQKRDSKEYYDN